MAAPSRIAITEWVKTDEAALKWHDDLEILLSREEAKELLERILTIRPDDPVAAENLERLRQME